MKYIPAWFPGAGFKRKAAAAKPIVDEFFEGPYLAVKAAMVIVLLALYPLIYMLTQVLGNGKSGSMLHIFSHI